MIRTMLSPILPAVLFAFLLSTSLGATHQPARGHVSVKRINYHGWPGAMSISNGIVTAVIVPQIGRVTAFEFDGEPASNVMFEDSHWLGKTVADTNPTLYANYGGDKIWPSPECDWKLHMPRGWPPSQVFDGGSQYCELLPNGVRLTTLDSDAFGARGVRTITMKPGEACLYVAQTIDKDDKVAPSYDGFRMGVKEVTGVRGDAMVLLPLARSRPIKAVSIVKSGAWVDGLDPDQVCVPPYDYRQSQVMTVTRNPKMDVKILVNPDANWIACLYSKRIVFSERCDSKLEPSLYPASDSPLEVYTNAPGASYIEMELLGPIAPVFHGQAVHYDEVWQLQRLPEAPGSRASLADLVDRCVSGKTAQKMGSR